MSILLKAAFEILLLRPYIYKLTCLRPLIENLLFDLAQFPKPLKIVLVHII